VDISRLDASKKPRQAGLLANMQDWQSALTREYEDLQAVICNTPVSRDLHPAGEVGDSHEDIAAEERRSEVPGSRAVRLGVAFHEAMERVDLFRPDSPGEERQELIVRHNLDLESAKKLDEMIQITLSSSLLERARTAAHSGGRIIRELPFVRPLNNNSIEEGKIDLLFEEGDGWLLVDYKTDWVSAKTEDAEGYFRGKYSGQIREYVEALRALSIKVASAYLLLARTGTAIHMM
jgi:ATP-dependent exoDNAse (exonuclease V) beta subunit